MNNNLQNIKKYLEKLYKKFNYDANYYNIIHKSLLIPSIILTSTASVFSFLSTSTDNQKIKDKYILGVALITAISGILQTINGSFNFTKKKDNFIKATREINSLIDKITFELVNPNEDDIINFIENDIMRIKKECGFML